MYCNPGQIYFFFFQVKIRTVRPTAFDDAAASGGSASEETLAAAESPDNSEFVKQELSKSDRPELASAKVRICWGNQSEIFCRF